MKMNNNLKKQISQEILAANYWEHFKFAKELSLILPSENTKRKIITDELNNIITKLYKQ